MAHVVMDIAFVILAFMGLIARMFLVRESFVTMTRGQTNKSVNIVVPLGIAILIMKLG